MNLKDTHIIVLNKESADVKPHKRTLYRTIKAILNNPFRYIKNTSSDIGNNFHDLATQIIKSDLTNPMVVIPTGGSSKDHSRDYHIVITKESINLIRCTYIVLDSLRIYYPIEFFLNKRTLLIADKFRKLYRSPLRDLL